MQKPSPKEHCMEVLKYPALSRGVSLIELLVSIFLFSFLISFLSEYYIKVKYLELKQRAITNEAFTVFSAAELIRNMTRSAGFSPCLPLNHLRVTDLREIKSHWEVLSVTEMPHSSIQFARMGEPFYRVSSLSNRELLIAMKHCPPLKHPFLIASCTKAEIQEVLDCTANRGIATIFLKEPTHFEIDEEIWFGEWQEERIFADNKKGEMNLFYQREQITPQVLFSQVKDFHAVLKHRKHHVFLETEFILRGEKVSFLTRARML